MWAGSWSRAGYGRMRHAGRLEPTHRLAAWAYLGHPLSGGPVLHRDTCPCRACFNPEHLLPVADRSQMSRRTAGRRDVSGDRNGRACLTRPQARLAVRLCSEGRLDDAEVAAAIGAPGALLVVARLRARRTWRRLWEEELRG